jgi:2-amino-1-hydroxyethylphosphonate dioxygenase (glycine-forming)
MNPIEMNTARAIHILQNSESTNYIGESVSQLTHSLQCAYFAEQSGHSEEVVLASLFHDIGHFIPEAKQFTMADLGVIHHEWIGAHVAYSLGFSVKVALLIGYHVDAKRYLAAKKESYYDRLSQASKGTLAFQGGVMSAHEMKQFESHFYFKEILQVRINDEKGKELDLNVPNLAYYATRIKQHLTVNSSNHNLSEHRLLNDYVDQQWVNQLKNQLNDLAVENHRYSEI